MEEFEGGQELTVDEINIMKKFIKEDMDKSQVLKIISKNKLPKLKKKINHIMNLFFNIPLISLDGKKNILKEKYILVLPIYNVVKPENRSNSLKRALVLHCLLLTEGYKLEGGEDILKTRDSLIDQLSILKEIFIILSITHPEYKWDFDFQI